MSAWHVSRQPFQQVKYSFLKNRGEVPLHAPRVRSPLSVSWPRLSARGRAGLGCCTRAFWAWCVGSHGGGGSCWGARARGVWASAARGRRRPGSRLESAGSGATVHRLTACGIFPGLDSNRCLLRWQADCFPLNRDRPLHTAQVSGGWRSAAPPEVPFMETAQPRDPAVPLADGCPKETKTLAQKETCAPMFIAALFTINRDVEITQVSISGRVEKEDVRLTRRGISQP